MSACNISNYIYIYIILNQRANKFKYSPLMDPTTSDFKKKDPDSFSLDPDNPDILDTCDILDLGRRPIQFDVQNLSMPPVLSPINVASPKLSPKLRKMDSFSQEEMKPNPTFEDFVSFPMNIRMTLNLCESFNKETKTVKKINNFISTMEENLKLTESLVKSQEKRIDEFFQEVYDLFNKNFLKMAETYKQNLKSRIQEELTDYRYTHEIIKSNLDHIMQHDSFSKLLQQELLSLNTLIGQTSQFPDLNNLKAGTETEAKPDINQIYMQFLDESTDLKFGITPLVKKFKLIEFVLQPNHDKSILSQSFSQNISEVKKEPFKDFVNIHAELESFVAKLSANFSHEISTISHPHTPFIYNIDKIAKGGSKVLPFDSQGKTITQPEPEESTALRKRLSQIETEDSQRQATDDSSSLEKDPNKDKEKEIKEPKSPQLSNRSASDSGKAPVSLTPVKNVTYKVPSKENVFTTTTSWFGDMGEVSYQTQLISVHNNLSVGDLVSINGAPYRITHKEWIFPEDTIEMVNIFTGERIEVKYNSRYSGMEDQIMTKKYQVIKISENKGYYLLMDMAWDKSDTLKRLPKIIEMKNVLDKKLEDDIREAFHSDKKALVHVLKVKDEEVIVSYRKEHL